MNVRELTGAMLDYWTGRAEGIPADQLRIQTGQRTTDLICVRGGRDRYDPSTNPAAGWPIIDRLGVRIGPYLGGWEASYCGWQCGASSLEAAMRVYVASVFGQAVPDEDTAPVGALTALADKVAALVGDGQSQIVRVAGGLEHDVEELAEMAEVSGAMPGEFRVACKFVRSNERFGRMTMRAVLL